jgi:site-specific recombinase XerD
MSELLLDRAGRRRSPATMPGFHAGHAPGSKRRREVGMDGWGWEQLRPWLDMRRQLQVAPLLCVINGTTRGRARSSAAARSELRRAAPAAGVRRRFAPYQLRHPHAVEMAREGVPLIVTQRQLGHSNLGITSVYLQGIDAVRSSRPCTPDGRP